MCIAVPVVVVEVYKNQALVSFGGVKTKVNTSLVDRLELGDYVLIHVGCAIEKIDREEAERTLEVFKHILKD
ncbi:HypC/HybG/HupF family hydrogenase formation chaperone [Wukongibacter sp. M2B1]|uniref:HypC/HybG/HupF family hydrogenase formation chaperone n=1 Tax=Wukongibacter sp. M2B1 TaxID=3088895 RepID=UPI003D7AE3C7